MGNTTGKKTSTKSEAALSEHQQEADAITTRKGAVRGRATHGGGQEPNAPAATATHSPARDRIPSGNQCQQQPNATAATATLAPARDMTPSGNQQETNPTTKTTGAAADTAIPGDRQETHATAITTLASARDMAPTVRTTPAPANEKVTSARQQNPQAPARSRTAPSGNEQEADAITRRNVAAGGRATSGGGQETNPTASTATHAPARDLTPSGNQQEANPTTRTTDDAAIDRAVSGDRQELHATANTTRTDSGDAQSTSGKSSLFRFFSLWRGEGRRETNPTITVTAPAENHQEADAIVGSTRTQASGMERPGDRREAKFEEAMRLLRKSRKGYVGDAVRLLHEYKADVNHDLEAAMVARFNNPGHDAVDMDQPSLHVEKLKEDVATAMNRSLSEWIEGVTEWRDNTGGGGRAGGGITPQFVLPRLFEECLKVVDERHRVIDSILFPAGRTVDERYRVIDSTLFPAGRTVDKVKMRQHMKNHYRDLFLLESSEDREQAAKRIFQGVYDHLQQHSFHPDHITWIIKSSDLGAVAVKYMKIMVKARLQDPPAKFLTTDFYKKQQFDTDVLCDVGAEGILPGEECTIVFPAVMVGKEQRTKGYAMRFVEAASQVLADANWDSKEDPQHLCGSPSDDICPDQDNLGPQGAPE